MQHQVGTIFLNDMPGTDRVLFHVVGTRSSEVLSKTEAVVRGVFEIRRGTQISGPADVLNEIRLKGQIALNYDVSNASGNNIH